ncbi:MAG: hypothetical protein ABI856_20570 [Nitrospira sp.]
MTDYLPLLSGLIGALIGAGASVAAQMIQARSQNKRDRTKLIVDMALADQRHKFEIAAKGCLAMTLYPLPVFVHYHAGLLTLLESNAMTPETLKTLKEENGKIIDMLEGKPPRT